MRKPRIIILAATIVAMLALIWLTVAIRSPRVPDPVYNGHHLSYWLSPSGFRGTNWDFRALSFARTALDSNAVPYLKRELKTRDGPLRVAYERLWAHFPTWVKARFPSPRTAMEKKGIACLFLGVMGATARPAIPELIRVLHQDESEPVRNIAASALEGIASHDDQRVIDALVTAAMADSNTNVRQNATTVLVRFNPGAAAKAGVYHWP